MRVLVTAGGTREPIDDVRVVANTSTGRLGAAVAEAAADAGHEVVLLRAAVGCAEPRVPVRTHTFETSADLGGLLAVQAPLADAVVHAAAVSDYVPVREPGKLSSDAPELVLRLRRAPKLIDELRRLCPRGVLVGFKLTSGVGEERQVEVAEALRRRARLDLVVANDAAVTGPADHAALIVAPEGVVARCRGKAAIAEALVSLLGEAARHGVTRA